MFEAIEDGLTNDWHMYFEISIIWTSNIYLSNKIDDITKMIWVCDHIFRMEKVHCRFRKELVQFHRPSATISSKKFTSLWHDCLRCMSFENERRASNGVSNDGLSLIFDEAYLRCMSFENERRASDGGLNDGLSLIFDEACLRCMSFENERRASNGRSWLSLLHSMVSKRKYQLKLRYLDQSYRSLLNRSKD